MENSIYKELHLDSALRIAGTSDNPTFILDRAMKIDYLKVKSITLPLTFNNVRSSNNTFLLYEEDTPDIPRQVQLDEGNYNIETLRAHMEGKINFQGTQIYFVQADPVTQRYRIGTNAARNFKLVFPNTNHSNTLLGFRVNTDTGYGKDFTAPFKANINNVDSVYLCSNFLSTNSTILGKPIIGSVLCRFFLNVPNGAVQNWDFSSCNYDIVRADQSISQIDLFLLDSATLEPLQLNGNTFNVTLSVWS